MFEKKRMKKLNEYLKESLLDDFDDLIDASDKNVKRTEVNNPDFISMYGSGWIVEGNTAIIRDLSYKGKRINRNFHMSPYILIGQKSIDEWLGTDEVRVEKTGLNLEGSIISKDTFSKKITMDKKYWQNLHIFGNNLTIKDIEINGELELASDDQILISNSILNVYSDLTRFDINSCKIPEFNKFKSNVQRMDISDTLIFDGVGDKDAVSQIDKHLALPYTVKVMDCNKNEEVDIKIKSFKKILSIIKNSKRYTPMGQVLRFKPGFKVTDLIDISGCKKLTELNIYNSFALLKIAKYGKMGTDIGSEESPQSTRVDDYVISVRKISKYTDI
jgi:hypothetical protein